MRPISSSLFYDIVKDTYCIYTKASISKLRTIITKDDIIKLDNIDKTITSIDPSLRTIAIGMREISSNQI